MKKSVHTREYRIFLELLRQLRVDANTTQEELAAMLGETQSAFSKAERGERRLDLVQVRAICEALGSTLPAFVSAFEQQLNR